MRLDRPDEILISPGLALYYIALDLSEPPMDNLALRQALTMAIDREMLVDIIGRGERPAFGIVPDNVAGHRSARFSWQNESQEELNRRARRGRYPRDSRACSDFDVARCSRRRSDA